MARNVCCLGRAVRLPPTQQAEKSSRCVRRFVQRKEVLCVRAAEARLPGEYRRDGSKFQRWMKRLSAVNENFGLAARARSTKRRVDLESAREVRAKGNFPRDAQRFAAAGKDLESAH